MKNGRTFGKQNKVAFRLILYISVPHQQKVAFKYHEL